MASAKKKPAKEKTTKAEREAAKIAKRAKQRSEKEKQDKTDKAERVLAVARDTMCGDLRTIMLDLFRTRTKDWQKMSEKEQADVIEMIETSLNKTLDEAVRIIAADERVTAIGTLDSVTIKDGLKLAISVPKRDKERHAICDAQGLEILLVVANSKNFKGEKEPAKTDPDQPGLPLANAIQQAWEKDDADAAAKAGTDTDPDSAEVAAETGEGEDAVV